MSIDIDVLTEYSRFVDWEGDPKWTQVPMDPAVARELAVDGHWAQCLSTDQPVDACVSRMWSSLKDLLPRTVAALSAKTAYLAILRTDLSGLSLVYFLGAGDDVELRRGFSPSHILPEVSSDLPVDLAPFYQLHDGFVNFMSYDGGLLPSAKWRPIVNPDSGRPSFIEIATDGSRGFGFDISERPVVGYVLRPDEGEVTAVTDAWSFLDALMASQIESIQNIK